MKRGRKPIKRTEADCRVCERCGKLLPLSDFYRRKSGEWMYICKRCNNRHCVEAQIRRKFQRIGVLAALDDVRNDERVVAMKWAILKDLGWYDRRSLNCNLPLPPHVQRVRDGLE